MGGRQTDHGLGWRAPEAVAEAATTGLSGSAQRDALVLPGTPCSS